MPNVKGPSQAKRQVMAETVNSIILYAALIWHGAMRLGSHKSRMEKVQRMTALRTISAYRTVSLTRKNGPKNRRAGSWSIVAAQVIAGAVPIHDWWKRTLRREERSTTEDLWQDEWRRSTQGAWTRTLIPDIRPWIRRKHGEFLTGHGCFRTYLHRIGKIGDTRC
ncbi:hypothetical protein NQ315_006686 [Exocentrus adspersus]|uniref:Uncharacterized protein n=1 Tax=Exocentrus adspersus TaxID=1586481 RepID=A0AAV8WCI5_9CUCU|nr:hypothetical protein NQ315_006686 [Exocentrus adspersus]